MEGEMPYEEGMMPGTTEICIDRTVEILDGTF